jgi:hypothetical protein
MGTTETNKAWENKKMKAITLNKLNRVEAPAADKAKGIAAYQVIEFTIEYFGNLIETTHDTKILDNGNQFVIGGCGFIPNGFQIK